MSERRYQTRTCKLCKKTFYPAFPNQYVHQKCRRPWKRIVQCKYQRKVRRELKMGLMECKENEA